ncbi:uncharacterized protein LOC125043516 isoform X2 [Penaeus chinensis]|uniref:uncharacterized protein LOC125043516 isoform X2 n=1 Tax=Penaeus chinensis TaxID=139456 RepID=UPI001FB64D9F|nr:uncharacterized protein LOC125043516 isoform X2 [Penaeus chinensis]
MRLEESPSFASGMEDRRSCPSLERYGSSESPPGSAPPPPSPPPTAHLVRSYSKATLGSRMSVHESASCPLESHHQGKLLLNASVSLPVDAVFAFMFEQPEFMLEVYADQKAFDVVPQPWQSVDERRKTRTVTYTLTLPPSSMGPKVCSVTERQVLLPQSQPGSLYLVEAEVTNGGIPYGDSFYVANHYCLTKEADGGTKVIMWSNVKYKKNVWGFMKEPQKTDTAEARYNWLVAVLLVMLMLVGMCNVFLYRQLFYLEDLASNQQFSDEIPDIRYLGEGGSWDNVANILQRQDQRHAKQMTKWSHVINEASQQLQQVQESLRDIAKNIPQHQEKLIAALIQESKARVQDIMAERNTEEKVSFEKISEQNIIAEKASDYIMAKRTSEEDIAVE